MGTWGNTVAGNKFPYQKPNTDIDLAQMALRQRWPVPPAARRRLADSVLSVSLDGQQDIGIRLLAARVADGFTRTNLRAIDTAVRASGDSEGGLTRAEFVEGLQARVAAHERGETGFDASRALSPERIGADGRLSASEALPSPGPGSGPAPVPDPPDAVAAVGDLPGQAGACSRGPGPTGPTEDLLELAKRCLQGR